MRDDAKTFEDYGIKDGDLIDAWQLKAVCDTTKRDITPIIDYYYKYAEDNEKEIQKSH